MYSKMLLSFFIVNCPYNSLLFCSMISGQVPPIQSIFITTVILYQMICIFLMHLCTTKINQKIPKPIKLFMRLNILNRNSKNLIKIRNNNIIQVFYSEQRFGFSYSESFGLISMMAFVKVFVVVV